MAAISGEKTIAEELAASFEPASVHSGSTLDRVAGFKPAILAIRDSGKYQEIEKKYFKIDIYGS